MIAMNVEALYVHALEGRLRLRIPRVKGAAEQARAVERLLLQVTGVEYVSANPLTGSVLILYNPRLRQQEDLVSALRESGYLSPSGREAAAAANNPANPQGLVEKVTSTVAASLMELALTRLVSALI
jgi:cation-transporting ATPase V